MRSAIIGLDGVPVKLLQTLADNNTMPYMKQLIQQGTLTKMRSSLPPNSAASWNSMITGTNPGTHGVYGFTDFIPGTYTQSFHNSHKLKAQPFWRKTTEKTLIINLPAAYPAQPMNGTMITGFVSPSIEKSVYPNTQLPWLQKHGYQIDVNASLFKESIPLFISQLNEALDKRVETLDHLLKQQRYDTLFFIVTGTDRIEHYLWHAYTDKTHTHYQDFLDFYARIDQVIEHIVEQLPDDAPLMMLSDHGMGSIETAVNINTLLRQEGYLTNDNNLRKNYNNIKPETRAFAAEQTKIYLNHKDRFPNGSVTHDQTENIQEELIDLLTGLSVNGERVVKTVHRKQDVFSGPETGSAPDLVVIPNTGFTFKTGLFKEKLFEED
ncbi:MAG: alkaline phosphatase family protein, partial [Candidatus Bathyarchaeota archaeon]|nr:alkaline phosphatase family protein [Candidatus Bathyarchaeota archaeon]